MPEKGASLAQHALCRVVVLLLPTQNEVCEGYVLYRCVSVHGGVGCLVRGSLVPEGDAWYQGYLVPACLAGFQAHTQGES